MYKRQTNDNIVVEIHGSERGDEHLFYQVGKIVTKGKDRIITFPGNGKGIQIGKDSARDPSLALNNAGAVLEVHNSGSNLFYRLGSLQNRASAQPSVQWPGAAFVLPVPNQNNRAIAGSNPSVAMNNNGQIVVCYEAGSGQLASILGQLNAQRTSIAWGAPQQYDTGTRPSVALTSDGYIYETHEGSIPATPSALGLAAGFVTLAGGLIYQLIERLLQPGALGAMFQRVGFIQPASGNIKARIDWRDWLQVGAPSYFFDSGQKPQVATNDKLAVQVHETEAPLSTGLFANASLRYDRANWMSGNLTALEKRTLRDLSLPASHDTGAYMTGLLDLPAQTQDLDMLGQLNCGVRYFDIRPEYTGPKQTIDVTKFFTHHDIITGPPISLLISQIRQFMTDHEELIILRISQYKGFNQAVYNKFADVLTDDTRGLGPWLFKGDGQSLRLAEKPLSRYVKSDRGTVLIVADKELDGSADYVRNPYPNPTGIWRYRDWYASDPQNGDLTVFDIYGDTNDFKVMAFEEKPNTADNNATLANGTRLPRGQLPKYRWFNGVCRNTVQIGGKPQPVVCDLFLLSWTLTPQGAQTVTTDPAVYLSRTANKALVDTVTAMSTPPRTVNGRPVTINLIYTDVVEKSRSIDVALIRNGLVE